MDRVGELDRFLVGKLPDFIKARPEKVSRNVEKSLTNYRDKLDRFRFRKLRKIAGNVIK